MEPVARPWWKRALLVHVYLLPLMLVALWLRVAGLGGEHLYGDEAEYAIVARYLSRDLTFLAYPDIADMGATPFVSQPPLILYVMAFSMKLLGATDVAAILPSALFGVATVAAVYATGYRLGGRLVGLSSAAIVAVMPFHVEMSRRAMLDAGYVFFLVLTAYFCVAWLQDRSRRAAIGVGVAAACAALSKLPGALALPVVTAVLVVGIAAVVIAKMQGRASSKDVKETLLQGGLGAIPVVVGGLLYVGLLSYLQAMSNLMIKLQWQFGRVDTSQAQVQEVTQIARDASFYLSDPKFGFAALLGSTFVALAIVGAIALFVRFAIPGLRRAEDLVIPIFVGVLLAFFLYSDRKEGFYLLPFAPFSAILIGYAVDSLHRMLRWAGLKAVPRATRQVGIAAIAIAVLLVAFPSYAAASDSVDEFVRGDNQEKYFGYGTKEAAAFIQQRDPDAAMYGTLLGRFSLYWYNEQPAYHWYIDHTYLESQIKSGKLRYIVYEDYLGLAFDREYMKELINKYNGQEVESYRAGWGEVKVFELRP